MNQNIEAVFVLSVKTFEKRIEHIKKHFGELRINFEFILDFDPPELTSDCLSRIFEPSNTSLPQKSLVMKHIKAWRLGVERGCKNILVFEDDAILVKNFIKKTERVIEEVKNLEPGYLVNFGGYDTKVSDSFYLQKEFLIRQPIATTEGYLCDIESMRKRLQWLERNKVSLPADHLIRYIDEECGIAQYWLEKPLVQQGSVFGLFETYLDSNRRKHSRYYNFIRYHWNHFWRRSYRKQAVRIRQKIHFNN